MRGRNRNNKGPNPMSRSYESNGPDVKIRGTAAHIADKYVQLSRDAHASGDPVAAQNYMQHAEHYYRLLALAQAQFQPNAVIVRADDEREEYEDDGSEGDATDMAGDASEAGLSDAPQAQVASQPAQDIEPERERSQAREHPRGRNREQGNEFGRERGGERAERPRGRGRGQAAADAVDPALQPQPVIPHDEQPQLPAFITGGPVVQDRPAATAAADDGEGDAGAARRGRRRRYGRTTREDGDDAAPSKDEASAPAE
jgi:hypothetical protein